MNLVAADVRRLILFPEKRLEPYVGDYGSQAEFLARELIQFAYPWTMLEQFHSATDFYPRMDPEKRSRSRIHLIAIFLPFHLFACFGIGGVKAKKLRAKI